MVDPKHLSEAPTPFVEVRVEDIRNDPTLRSLCVGYELGKWRNAQFADHVMEWLPEFALSATELSQLGSANAVLLLRRAAKTVYESKKFENRGEFGEIFLHMAVRQIYRSLPAISKIYYKSATNDTVKGFDAVHIVGPPNDMELWLGEAKFYESITRAIADVTAEIETHLQTDYLRSEFMLITGKIDKEWPHASKLKNLLDPKTSLDQVFTRACIPVLLTYDSKCVRSHAACTPEYHADFVEEAARHHAAFAKKLREIRPPINVRVHLFLLPLHTKEDLIKALDRKLKAWQKL
ncbi:MAG: HamA C-terminal domain-containing protein [Phycisphaerae bacterium]